MNSSQLQDALAKFHGSEPFTRHGLVRTVIMTEGLAFLAEAAGAHWLTDAIASYVHDDRAQQEHFQVWRLVVDAQTHHATLTMTDGNSPAPIITQELDYTDFPLSTIELWLIADGRHWVMMLPSEY